MSSQSRCDLLVVGGGAAGYFAAIKACADKAGLRTVIIEQGKEPLGKVRISGGGRCNVTNACWDPRELVAHYPRGSKELIGPFNKFATGDCMDWFEKRGVPLKIEEDNRVFPTSDNSESIVNCLQEQADKYRIELRTSTRLNSMKWQNDHWLIGTNRGDISAKKLLLTPGSSKAIWKMLAELGHEIVPPVPSLFTFNCKDTRLKDLAGLSLASAELSIPDFKLQASGPLLITHWGLSGPAVLRLSAWGARKLETVDYKFQLLVNLESCYSEAFLEHMIANNPDKKIANLSPDGIPKRFWKSLCGKKGEEPYKSLKQTAQRAAFYQETSQISLIIRGKSTFKEEFVTAGGLHLKEVDFRKFKSKLLPNLYLAGEVLNIDAITGGFNFQAAWTGAWLAGMAIARDS